MLLYLCKECHCFVTVLVVTCSLGYVRGGDGFPVNIFSSLGSRLSRGG